MQEEVKYTDYLGERTITAKESESMERFCKEFRQDNLIKKIEEYKNNILFSVEYFLSENESQTEILRHFIPRVSHFVILSRRTTYEKWTVVKSTQYRMEEVLFIENILYDHRDNLIFIQDIDLVTGEPSHYDDEKSLFDDNNEWIADFKYDSTGALDSVWWSDLQDEGIINAENQRISGTEAIKKYCSELLLKHPYYKDATFLPKDLTT